MAKNKFEDAHWAKTQQQSITNQVALKAAVEIVGKEFNWNSATAKQKQEFFNDISFVSKVLFFEANKMPTKKDYELIYN